jgi:hypothetical protein
MNRSALGPQATNAKQYSRPRQRQGSANFDAVERVASASLRISSRETSASCSSISEQRAQLVCCCLGLCFRFESLFPWRSGVTLTFVVHEAAIKRADLPSAFCLTLNPSAAGLIRLYLGCFASLIFATPDFGAFWKSARYCARNRAEGEICSAQVSRN